jgi:hypothetical protein
MENTFYSEHLFSRANTFYREHEPLVSIALSPSDTLNVKCYKKNTFYIENTFYRANNRHP